MWRVQKLLFRIEGVREIVLDFSNDKAEILGIRARSVLGVNALGVVKLLDWSKSVTENAAGKT